MVKLTCEEAMELLSNEQFNWKVGARILHRDNYEMRRPYFDHEKVIKIDKEPFRKTYGSLKEVFAFLADFAMDCSHGDISLNKKNFVRLFNSLYAECYPKISRKAMAKVYVKDIDNFNEFIKDIIESKRQTGWNYFD